MHRAIFYEFHEGDPAMIPPAAAQLADAGVGLIELCGGLPLAFRAKVKEAVGGRTRVASVTFGIESIVKAAEFNHAFMAGNPEVHRKLRDEELIARNNEGHGFLNEPATLMGREAFQDQYDDSFKVALD